MVTEDRREDGDEDMERLRNEMVRPPYHGFLRPEAKSVDPETGAVTITLTYRPEFGRSPDAPGFHGGVLASLIDIAGHAVVAVRFGRMAPTIDLRIDYLRAADGSELVAQAKIVRAGRTMALADVEVTDAGGRVVAVGRGADGAGAIKQGDRNDICIAPCNAASFSSVMQRIVDQRVAGWCRAVAKSALLHFLWVFLDLCGCFGGFHPHPGRAALSLARRRSGWRCARYPRSGPARWPGGETILQTAADGFAI